MTFDDTRLRRGQPRGWLGRAALVVALVAGLAVPLSGWGARPAAAAASPAPVLHQWASPVSAGDFALGPDGNMWFVASGLVGGVMKTGLGKITPAGAITTYFDIWGTHCSTYYCQPAGLHFVGDQLYVAEDFEGTIWDFSISTGSPVAAAGPVSSPGSHTPRQITDTGGYLYVTNYDGVNYFPASLAPGNICWNVPWTYDTNGITVGPDGNIWTANGPDIGTVTPCTSGPATPTTYAAGLSPSSKIVDIVSAAGALWFTNSIPASSTPVQDTIGRITTSGVITEYPVPSAVPAFQTGILSTMAVASDGSIWFTEGNLNQVGRLSPANPSAITEYAMPDGTRVSHLATGPDGNMWYTGWSATTGDVIGELSLAQAPPPPDTPTTQPAVLRPDAWIRKHDWIGYIGNDVYNTTASGQTVGGVAPRAAARAFRVRIYNDGATPAVITLKATASPRGAVVRYFSGGEDVTAALTSSQGLTFTRAPGAFKGFRIRIDIGRHAAIGSRKAAKVVATSGTGSASQVDAVKAVVTVAKR